MSELLHYLIVLSYLLRGILSNCNVTQTRMWRGCWNKFDILWPLQFLPQRISSIIVQLRSSFLSHRWMNKCEDMEGKMKLLTEW